MQILKFPLFFFSILLFLSGCQENFPVYATFCDTNIEKPHCLKYPGISIEDKALLENKLGFKEDNTCPYTLKLTKYRMGSCNNPVVKSTGSDFDGYVRIEILEGFKCHYKVQSDYKNDLNAAYERVMDRAEMDLKAK